MPRRTDGGRRRCRQRASADGSGPRADRSRRSDEDAFASRPPLYLPHLDIVWEHPAYAAYLQGLARNLRLITYDKRGQGLSDRTPGHALATVRADDALTVLDAVGSDRAVLVGCSEGAEIAATAAVIAPDRVAALVCSAVARV